MYNMHREINRIDQDHVRLSKKARRMLAEHRDANLSRLKTGLEKLDYPSGFEHCNQGGYAMFTVIQRPNNDYDIDVAVLFEKEDLPGSAYDTRKRIELAMVEAGGNFSKPPEALTNAVRVYYTEGHHVDIAIFRVYDENHVEVCEHAGADWSPREPKEITDWFNDLVNQRSPSQQNGGTVDDGQMRRLVRWLKSFAKSRESWKLPGGLIISTLVAECYRPHLTRDDIALYDTVVAIHKRLSLNADVLNPVDASQTLTDRQVDRGRVQRFREKLELAQAELLVLHESQCTEDQAWKTWKWFFQHPYWDKDEVALARQTQGKQLGEAALQGSIYVSPSGRVNREKPNGRSTNAPRHSNFGDD